MSVKIKVNYNNDELYCFYSKQLIPLDTKYVEVTEDELGETIVKTYLMEFAPEDDSEEEPYISKD